MKNQIQFLKKNSYNKYHLEYYKRRRNRYALFLFKSPHTIRICINKFVYVTVKSHANFSENLD